MSRGVQARKMPFPSPCVGMYVPRLAYSEDEQKLTVRKSSASTKCPGFFPPFSIPHPFDDLSVCLLPPPPPYRSAAKCPLQGGGGVFFFGSKYEVGGLGEKERGGDAS